uniref:Uncharacterized protein n=1 Tax=Rhizophora mucronata TaxID=61149 RepID=A0A2P2ND08_RHIMU
MFWETKLFVGFVKSYQYLEVLLCP